MRKPIHKNSYKTILVVLAILIALASIYTHQLGDFLWYRSLRGIVSFTALGVLFYYRGKQTHPLLALFLIFHGSSSFITIWYESTPLATTALVFNFCSVLFLIRALFPKVSFKNMSWWLILIFVVFVVFNGFLLYEFVAMMKSFTGSTSQYLFMLLEAMSLVIVGFLALLYNYQFSSRSSLTFVFFIFLLIFSEVFRGIAYYDFAFGDLAVYIARMLLIMATFLLVHFSMLQKPEDETLYRKIL